MFHAPGGGRVVFISRNYPGKADAMLCHRVPPSTLLKCVLRIGLMLSLLSLSLCVAAKDAFTQSSQSSAATMQDISAALRAHEYERALQLVEPMVRDSPNDARLCSMQGIALTGLHRNSDALAAFQRALKTSPDYLPALEGAAQIEYQAGDKGALSLLQRILKTHPDDQTSHAMLGSLYYKQGDCAHAVSNFEGSREVIDTQPLALEQFGSCLAKLDRLDEASAEFLKIVNANPADTRLRMHLAALQLEARHPKDAIATLQPLLQSQSNAPSGQTDARVAELAGAAYEADGQTQQAVDLLNRAVAAYPKDIDLYLALAALAFDHHSFASGIEVMTSGLRLMPDAAPLYLERGILYVQLADYEKAQTDFQKAAEIDPRQTLSQVGQSKIAEEAGNFDEALAKVRRKLTRNPNDAFLLYTQSEILVQRGVQPGSHDFQVALESARKAVAINPKLPLARNILSTLYLSSGQTQAAAEQARRVLKDDPDNESAIYHLILSLRRNDKSAELPDLLQRLAKLRQNANKRYPPEKPGRSSGHASLAVAAQQGQLFSEWQRNWGVFACGTLR